ncbi:glutathione S-transferase [Arenibacterium halophilum]|uniref:Glutathione S-transferase n=1 Tax=Arenibacterium halophilum TaxID=2583821 RepID=A0ABY2X5V6_9RHOB|nr:glutathione S-transferase [Arenibacterium halophilum]TMV10840.1 glutathione S-transferase [Arenibacterium halophilum]
MKLFYSATSPYVRKVMMVLHETGQLDDVALEPVATTPIAPAEPLALRNPLAKVPALERDDGATLFDSRVICAYLDRRGNGGLYGHGDREWELRTLESLADGILDAALAMTYEGRLRPEQHRWDDWVEGQWGKIARAVATLDNRWMGHLAGPVNIGQIAVGAALGYVDFRHGARNWRDGNESLAEWYAGFESHASMAATRPPAGA